MVPHYMQNCVEYKQFHFYTQFQESIFVSRDDLHTLGIFVGQTWDHKVSIAMSHGSETKMSKKINGIKSLAPIDILLIV